MNTSRLCLRPFTLEDTIAMHQIINGKDVLKYFPGTQTLTAAQVRRMIERMVAHWQEHHYGLWAVELRETAVLLGRCGLQYIAETDEVEIDFILDRAYWGQGIATEAGKLALQFGLETLQHPLIVGVVHPENKASQRVLTKIGMQFMKETEYFGMACYKYTITHSSEV